MSPLEAMARAMRSVVPFHSPSLADELARAALVALRDNGVTEGMKYPGRPEGCVPGERIRPETLFRAMLDAALKENSDAE